MIEEKNILSRKIEYFLKNNIKVHISLSNGKFFNGKILEFVGDMITVDDDFLGTAPVYLDEIRYIEPFKEKEEERK